MNNESKNLLKKSWKGLNWLRAWLIIVAATFLILFIVTRFIPGGPQGLEDWLIMLFFMLLGSAVVATVFVGLWVFIRWLCCRRNLKRFLFACACLVTLIALAYAEEDWRAKYDWEKFKHEWQAKGESFDRQSVVPASVPDDQNFALTPIVFTCYGSMLTRNGKEIPYKDRPKNFINRLQMSVVRDDDDWPTNGNWQKSQLTDLRPWQSYYRKLAATTNLFPVTPQPQSPAADVLLALSKYDATIEEVRQASQLPYARFPLEYDKDYPGAILLPHLASLKRLSQTLELRAIAELQNGQSDKALDDIKLILRLTDSIRGEPFLISQLVRIAMCQIALQPIYEGLAEHEWLEAQLVELDSELAKLDFLSDYKLAMRGEMVLCQAGTFDYLRKNPEQILNWGNNFMGGNPPLFARLICHLIPSAWFYRNELNCTRAIVKYYLPQADVDQAMVSPSSVRRADAAIARETKHANLYNIFERIMLPGLSGAVERFVYGQNAANIARAAIALERYHLEQGNYPDSLDALELVFIKQLPDDIISGRPLHYHPTSDRQFVLYSVGWNERDDGGVVVLRKDSKPPTVNINQGDWVWRYPTK